MSNRNSIALVAMTMLAALVALTGCGNPNTDSTDDLYLDVHLLGAGNVTADAVAAAHEKDLAVQGKYGVSFERYWVDESAGVVYCLAHAPDADSVSRAHAEAHGLVPDAVHPVVQGS